MKKIFDKVITVTLGVISLFFVILMLITAFGGLETADFDNEIVKALLITLGIIFAVLTGLNVWIAFQDNEKLSSILLFKDKESATKATVGVVKKTARRVTKKIEEAKIGKIQIFADENGNARLKVDVKLTTDATMDTVTKLRAILIDTFKNIFGIEFAAIDFRVVKSKNAYEPADADVQARMEQLRGELIPNVPTAEGEIRIESEDGIIIPEGGDTDKDIAAEATAEETEQTGNAAEEETAPEASEPIAEETASDEETLLESEGSDAEPVAEEAKDEVPVESGDNNENNDTDAATETEKE